MKRILFAILLGSLCGFLVPTEGPAQPEVRRAKGYIPPNPALKAKLHELAFAKHGRRLERIAKFQTLPPAFDCRDKGWVLPVGDQGSCGSCYLYSTIYGTLTSAFVRAGYGKADGSFVMSPQYGMDCHNFGGCNGGNGTEVIAWIIQNGWYAESWVDLDGKAHKDYPGYTARSSSCRKVAGAKLWKPADWGFATGDQSNRTPTTEEIKTALFNFGPLNVSLDAGGQFGSGSGTITSLGSNIDHEIEMVAYDDTKGAFLLKNQWTTDWGDGGYRWVTYAAAKQIVDIFWVSVTALPPPIPPTPPVPPVPPVPPAPPAPPVPVDFPLDISGDTYIVVRTFPVKVTAGFDADLYFWSFPVGVTATDKGKVLEVAGAPGGSSTISVKALSIDWAGKKVVSKFSQTSIVVAPAKEEQTSTTEEPPLIEEPTQVSPRLTYHEMSGLALKMKSPLVVFVDCEPLKQRDYDPLLMYRCGPREWFDLTKEQLRGIIVSVPKDGLLLRGNNLSANATYAQIDAEINRLRPREARTFSGGRVDTLERLPFQTPIRSC